MISVLLSVFLLQLLIHLINTAGKQTINDTAWHLFSKLPTPQSQAAADLSSLRREVVRLNREMNATSAQDEFAKWAKLRRQHDKAKDKYDEKAQSQETFKQTFTRALTLLRFLATQGLNFFFNTYYSKTPLFWLPAHWVPHAAEWLLSFPRAPLGSISVNVWAIACASVIALVSEGVVGVWTLRKGEVVVGPMKGEKITMEEKRGAKKEL